MNARIHWKTKEDGGRSNPPAGVGSSPYAPIVRFKDASEPWPPHVAWSLVVKKVLELSEEYEWVAQVHFLVKEAPVAELSVGREFELYEGGRCVATGVLIESGGGGT